MSEPLLKITALKKYFPIKRGLLYRIVGWIRAVDGVSLEVEKGKTLGLVGESGCGKTTLGRLILRLLKLDEGEILFQGKNISQFTQRRMRRLRKDMQIVFQDPFGSLNPRFTIGRIVAEPLHIFRGLTKSRKEIEERVKGLLEIVGLPKEAINRYPHEFSGGQRQRICIARAIGLNPAFLVLDEPVSSLDVSIQAQIIKLLCSLQERLNLSYLFISHDLNVTRLLSDEAAVMYLGKIVEKANNEELFKRPAHPYTRVLLEAIPVSDPKQRQKRHLLKGELSSALNPPSGCRFRTRCSYAMDICTHKEPPLTEIAPAHIVACHLLEVP